MAEDASPRHMSLIPYASTSREVVLQQGGAVVVYDAQSKSLSVQYDELAKDDTECPYCHRPYADTAEEDTRYRRSGRAPRERSFVDPEYFRMLAQSQRATPAHSGIQTPAAPFAHFIPRALRSGRSRDVSGSQQPPPPVDAEFVASQPNPAYAQGISSSALSPGYYTKFFREERELGRGGYGVVLLAEHILDGISLGHYACKRIPVGNNHEWLQQVLVEVKLLILISHVNLVQYYHAWVEEHKPSTFGPKIPCVWILQQYCNAGDLHHYVIGQKDNLDSPENLKARFRRQSRGQLTPPDVMQRLSRLTLEEIFSFFKDITSGLHHLHLKGYVHRDIKPSNCLLHVEDGRTRVLLSDFGEVQATGTRRTSTGATGTISYCAPEVLQVDKDGKYGEFTTKSDVFSLGMVVHFMCFGRLPYDNAFNEAEQDSEDLDLLRAEITAWQGFADSSRTRRDLPDRLYRYLQRLLSVDASERPSTEEILSSIKFNTNFGDTRETSPSPHQSTSRIIPLDTPARGSSRDTVGGERPDSSQTARKASGLSLERSISPTKRSRHHNADDDAARPSSRRQSPLMLPPPPPPTLLRSMRDRIRQPSNVYLARVGVLLAKMMLMVSACTPYAPRAIVLYPLALVALFEVSFLELSIAKSLTSLMLHIVIMWLVREHLGLCERTAGAMLTWAEDMPRT